MQKKFVIFYLLCIVLLGSVFQNVETVKADYYMLGDFSDAQTLDQIICINISYIRKGVIT